MIPEAYRDQRGERASPSSGGPTRSFVPSYTLMRLSNPRFKPGFVAVIVSWNCLKRRLEQRLFGSEFSPFRLRNSLELRLAATNCGKLAR